MVFLKNTSIDVLKQNLIELNEQINQLKVLLDESEDRDRKNQIQIKNLGKKLNLALAGKVQELSEFQSIFLKKIKSFQIILKIVESPNDLKMFPGSVIFVPRKIDNSATRRLATQAYVSILGNLGVALASLSAIDNN